MKVLSISQTSIVALISQVVSFVVGFGVINNGQAGVVIAAATAVVSAAFVVGNSIHHLAIAKVAAAQVTPAPAPKA